MKINRKKKFLKFWKWSKKENQKYLNPLIDFVRKDLPSKYQELKKQHNPVTKIEDIPVAKKKSILDRIKPRNKKNIKVLQEIAEVKTEEKEGQEKTKKDPSKVRCKFWPTCKEQDCPYAHPKEQCKFFPHCHYKDKCINIHPAIPCKFGMFCRRPDCAYVHPTVMNMIFKKQQKHQGENGKGVLDVQKDFNNNFKKSNK